MRPRTAPLCSRFDWPPVAARLEYPLQTLVGGTTPDWTDSGRDINDQRSMEQLLVSILCGPAFEGVNLDLVDWPLEPDHWPEASQGDGAQAQFLCERLGLDQIGWLKFTFQATTLCREPAFRFLVCEIADALDRTELLLQPELIRIYQRT